MYDGMLREGQPVMVTSEDGTRQTQGQIVMYYASRNGEDPNGYIVQTKEGEFFVRTWEISLLDDNGQDYE